jgi:hypothetical protein
MFFSKEPSKPTTSLISGLGYPPSRVTGDGTAPGSSQNTNNLKQAYQDASKLYVPVPWQCVELTFSVSNAFKEIRSNCKAKQSASAAIDSIHERFDALSAANYEAARTAAASYPDTETGNTFSETKEEVDPNEAARSVAGAFFGVLEAQRTELQQREKTDNLYAQNNLDFFPEQAKLVRMNVATQTAQSFAQEEWAKYKKENPGEGSMVSQWLLKRGVPEEDVDSLMESLGGCSTLNGTEVPEVKRGWRDS